MKKLDLNGGKPMTSVYESVAPTLAPAAGLFVPLILLVSFLHSLFLLGAVLVFFLSLPFIVYGFSERHRLVAFISAGFMMIAVFGIVRALGIF